MNLLFRYFFKKPKGFWIIAVGIFLSYLIVGYGVYLWQNPIAQEKESLKDQNIKQLLQKSSNLEQNIKENEDKFNSQKELYQNNVISSDIGGVKVGDKLANGMIVALADNRKWFFSGPIVVSGNYLYDKVSGSHQVCVKLDSKSNVLAPKVFMDEVVDLCFLNQDVAKRRFGSIGSSGITTVIIDNYMVDNSAGGFAYGADLIKVLEIK